MSIYSRTKRPGDDALFQSSVLCMASSPRQEFPPELGAAVVDKASALLQSVRRTPLQAAEFLSVAKAWSIWTLL